MIDPEGAIDILYRIAETRRARCGGDAWVKPPDDWPAIVQRSWSHVWSAESSRAPDGWVDLLMAFSEHAGELGSDPYDDAFENSVTGRLHISHFYGDLTEELRDIRQGYEEVSLSICTVCGAEGEVRRIMQPVNKGMSLLGVHVRCEEHAGGENG